MGQVSCGSRGENLLQRELATVGPMPRLETMKNSNVFSWVEAYLELCFEPPLALTPSINQMSASRNAALMEPTL